ncbi:MAG: Gfo/Idh/MocA family oxidoreductase [Chloroflexota bacterium]
MARPLRVGVAGLGRAGAGMLAALAVHPGVEVSAAADLHPEHLARFKADFEGETYDSVDALCASPHVDAVYIATPHQFHEAHVIAAARAGKHIVVEKPMGLTVAECLAMTEAAEAAGVALIVGHTASFNPAVLRMRELIASRQVGRLAMISATAHTDFLYRPRRPEELVTVLGGGIMYNQVPHQVDAARYVAGGMAASVRAVTYVLDPARPTEGAYAGLLTFEDGPVAVLSYAGYDHFDSSELASGNARDAARYGSARRALTGVGSPDDEIALRVDTGYGGGHPVASKGAQMGGGSLLQPELGSFLLTCERADLRLLPDGVGVYGDDGFRLEPPAPWRGTPGRGNVLDELLGAVNDGAPVVHGGRWAAATMEVCLAMLGSAREGCEVVLRHQVPLGG